MKEQISALMDGEIDLEASPHLLTALKAGNEATTCWATYHLIGDVLRNEMPMKPDVSSRIMQKIASEPVVLAPRRRFNQLLQSAHLVPMAASAAAVAFVGWMVWQSQGYSLQNETAPASVAQNVISPEAINHYMLAHHEYAPGNAMQHSYNIQPANYSESRN